MRKRDLKWANQVYSNPKGYSKEELVECLQVLNGQGVVFSQIQSLAIADAHTRLGVAIHDVEKVFKEVNGGKSNE